jgi:AraC-like DNA-binding protein/mannose-6-phosphate isomerase-like protein (cupin superfamily)
VRNPPIARVCARRANADFTLFHGHEAPLPEFPAFTHINEAVCTAAHVLHEHAHRHYEFCYIHAGYATWTVGGERFRLRPGDFFVARPGEVHSGRPDPKRPNHNFAVGFDPAQLALPRRLTADALGAREVSLAASEASEVAPVDGPLALRVIPGGQGAERIYRRILAELDAIDGESSPVKRRLCCIQVQALLAELFVLVARLALAHLERSAPPRSEPSPRREIAALLEWLPEHLAAPPTLGAMAKRAGLSPSQFALVFKREVGRTPIEHLTLLRMQEAETRLKRGATVTDTALALGYCSPQYFSAVYKRHHGCAPSATRR